MAVRVAGGGAGSGRKRHSGGTQRRGGQRGGGSLHGRPLVVDARHLARHLAGHLARNLARNLPRYLGNLARNLRRSLSSLAGKLGSLARKLARYLWGIGAVGSEVWVGAGNLAGNRCHAGSCHGIWHLIWHLVRLHGICLHGTGRRHGHRAHLERLVVHLVVYVGRHLAHHLVHGGIVHQVGVMRVRLRGCGVFGEFGVAKWQILVVL